MSIYFDVTEQDLFKLRKLANQQRYQRAVKNKKRFLKQTHDIKLAESSSPITKKLEEVEEYFQKQKLGDVFEETPESSENIEPVLQDSQSQTPELVSASDELVKTFSKKNDSKSFFKVIRDAEGKFSWSGKEVNPLGLKRVEIDGEEYNLTPEIQRAFTDTIIHF